MVEQESRTVFADVYGPPPRLFVYGAVDTAEALCAQARLLGWTTIVADARARFATRERIPSADELLVLWPDEALAHVAPDSGTAVLVLTHDDKFDLPLLDRRARAPRPSTSARSARGGTRRGGAACCSSRASPRRSSSASPGPRGLDVGADSPAETALSMLAEILAVRAGRARRPPEGVAASGSTPSPRRT